MNIPPNKQPTSWSDYERGRNQGSPAGSIGSHVQWGDSPHPESRNSSVVDDNEDHDNDAAWEARLRRRRSSLNIGIATLRRMGGVNSIDNFARSWSRAANFHEITPVRPHLRFEDGSEEGQGHEEAVVGTHSGRSLLHEQLQTSSSGSQVRPSHDSHLISEQTPLIAGSDSASRKGSIPPSWSDSIFSVQPSLRSGFGASIGTPYASQRRPSIIRPHIADVFREDAAKTANETEIEQEPFIIKQIEEDGVKFNVVVGQSTLPQTVFNSVNVLIGVGLLSLPLGVLYSGWVIGMVFMVFAAISTQYTAKLLAKCLDVDNSLITFADLAYVSFGSRARIATSILFSIELIAACVALVILFADSLNALTDIFSITTWKIICGLVLIPLSFLPLWLLSFTSVLGILSCLGIFLAVLIDGLIKTHQPGSLLEPAVTYLFPQNWQTIPLAFGLLMSPWGGHSVFPNIYRDMRHPYKYHRAVDVTYFFTFSLDMGMAILGMLMFGDNVHDEITSNILLTPGYPVALNYVIVICIAIIPLTKVPLNARPIVTTIEVLTGLWDPSRSPTEKDSLATTAGKVSVRVVTIILFVFISVIFPAFDRIMTLLGAVWCFSICIVLPVAFHLKLFSKEMSKKHKILDWSLLIISSLMAIVSTVFACMPRDFLDGSL